MSSYDWEVVGAAIVGFLTFLCAALIEAWIGVALWRAIMVKIFELPNLTFWQFYGLMMLIHIIFPGRPVRINKGDK